MVQAPTLPIRARNGQFSGELPPEVVREIAVRLRDGQRHDEISAALGMGKATGRRKCAEIAAAMGLPPQRSQYEIDTDDILRRIEEGEDDHRIAVALGRTVASVACIRRKHGIRYFTQLRMSDEENAEIERRLLAGESTRTVAAAVGCEQADVQRRLRRVAHRIPRDLPPCECGKPRNHGGRCNLVIDPALVRERLLAGKTATDIAREFNRTAQSFKPKYVDPIIAQLTSEGQLCGCGQPFGHQFTCSFTMAAQRRTFTEVERARATELVKAGASVAKVREALGITVNSARMLVGELRTNLATVGVKCPCGEPIDHGGTCVARNGSTEGRTGFRFASSTARAVSADTRRLTAKMAREGWPLSAIMRRTDETEWKITQLVDELGVAGQLPAKCRNCDQVYRHKGPCPKPKPARGERKRSLETKLTVEQQATVKRLYRNRHSLRAISRGTGIPFAVVQRFIKRQRAKSKRERAPCACGRPAGHGGSCWATKPGLVGPRHLTRIEQGILAGKTSHAMAEQLKLSVMTILKHSVPIRDRLFAEGVTCACGRPLNHNFWCSARWDAHDMPRGRRPFPGPQETLAVEALLRGDVVADIAKAVGVGPSSVWMLRRTLNDGQRAQRARAMRDRLARGLSLQGDALMARIRAVVSNRLDPVLRDDVISEIYLAVIEGRVEPEQIGAVARSFINRGLADWQSRYGPRSLDAKLFAEGSRTLADTLEDDTAVDQIEELSIGENEA